MAIRSTDLSFRQTGKFSALFCDYAENQEQLLPFHAGFPDARIFQNLISERVSGYSLRMRNLMCRILENQTHAVPFHPAQDISLRKLNSESCFTISCGHQLSIGGGPHYMLYKILTTIRLAAELEKLFPGNQFVPIFWLAGEDHDIDEIRSLRFFSKEYQIEVKGNGPCGRLSTAGIANQVRSIPDFPEAMIQAYEDSANLSDATRRWLHHYFGRQGLLVLDADCPDLKREFFPEMLAELKSPALAAEVRNQTAKLEYMGYSAQLHCRDLNLFYMEDGLRIRLEKQENGIQTIDGEKKWTQQEAEDYFSLHPEKLSPNACLRPLYSQKILPDIAFVGGPAEIAYWLQLKSAFEWHRISFPVLIPRFSALLLPQNRWERLQKLGLMPEDLFADAQELRKKISLGETDIPAPDLRTVFRELIDFARTMDAGTADSLEADLSRLEDQSKNMQRKVRRAAEKKSETQLRQLENLLEYCFPGDGLLERSESWLSTLAHNPRLMTELQDVIRPLHFRFEILLQES